MKLEELRNKWKQVLEEVALTANLAPYPVLPISIVKVKDDKKNLQKRNRKSLQNPNS